MNTVLAAKKNDEETETEAPETDLTKASTKAPTEAPTKAPLKGATKASPNGPSRRPPKRRPKRKAPPKGIKWTKENAGMKGLTISDGKNTLDIVEINRMNSPSLAYMGKVNGTTDPFVVNDYKDEKNFKVILKTS